MKMFAIKDSKGERFHLPFYQNTHGEAERAFSKTAQDPQSMINDYPEDFDLYHVGEYDEKTGKLSALDTPQHIVSASNFAKKS